MQSIKNELKNKRKYVLTTVVAIGFSILSHGVFAQPPQGPPSPPPPPGELLQKINPFKKKTKVKKDTLKTPAVAPAPTPGTPPPPPPNPLDLFKKKKKDTTRHVTPTH